MLRWSCIIQAIVWAVCALAYGCVCFNEWHQQVLLCTQGWTVQLMVKRSGLAVEEFQEDAQQFKPARWLESNGQPLKTNPKGFMPFGGVRKADTHC